MGAGSEIQFESLSLSVSHPNFRRVLSSEPREELVEHLRTNGKFPASGIGYEESGVRPRLRRVHRLFECAWNQDRFVLGLNPELADTLVAGLREDIIPTNDR